MTRTAIIPIDVRNEISPQFLRDIIDNANPYSRFVFVDSTATHASDTATDRGKSKTLPYATLATAVSESNPRDIILVAPGHAESITAADGINVTSAKTDLTIVGLGKASNMATITFSSGTTSDFEVDGTGLTLINLAFVHSVDSAAATLDINADDCTVKDCKFTVSGADAAAIIDVGADDCTISGCRFFTSGLSATENPDDWIEVAGAISRLRVENCYLNDTTTGSASFLAAGAAITDFWFSGNTIKGDFSTATVRGAAAWVNFYNDVSSNRLSNVNAAGVDFTRTGSWSEYHRLDGDWWTYLEQDVDAMETAGAKETANPHELYTVTGDIEFKLVVTVDLAIEGTSSTVSLGMGAATAVLAAAVPEATLLAGYTFGPIHSFSTGHDIGYAVGTADLTAGAIDTRLWYRGEGKAVAVGTVTAAVL